jgi:tungstate transport system ATP-binding protein
MSDVSVPFVAAPPGARGAASLLLPVHVRDVAYEIDGQALLDGVDLTLDPGGCTVIMGANGAGKSLLLRVMHGLIQPTRGQIDWNGNGLQEAKPRQALVFQKPVLLRRTVAANVDFVLRTRGLSRDRCAPMLAHVGLSHKARQPARLLSGGEQQRLALACALATDPDVLFLDEPTASLDPAAVQAIESIVTQAQARGTRIVFVTHDPGQARRLADDIVFLHRGRVAAHVPAHRFFPKPQCQVACDYLDGKIVA